MTAFAVCRDMEAAREACQEAFLVAWRGLPALREPAAFGDWLKRLVRTQCSRARRRHADRAPVRELATTASRLAADQEDAATRLQRLEASRLIRNTVQQLPPREREAVIRFYFLGEPLRDIAQVLGVSVGHAGKQVYSARLRLRRRLPRSITETFLGCSPTPAFARGLRAGVFDECVGEYRFPARPDYTVIIRREGDTLVSYAGGQRNVLVSRKPDSLTPGEFDGEGRFRRDRDGRITHFIYYEFGRRLGVARRIRSREPV